MKKPLYQAISQTVDAYHRCVLNGNSFAQNHKNDLIDYEELLPKGSGFDRGTKINLEKSSRNKIVLNTSFHHMDQNGFYDGWTEHEITVRPDLCFGFSISISGKNKNGIKEYIHECFNNNLMVEI